MDEMYLVWSNEHRAWWRPNAAGYTGFVAAAGRYSREDAIKHCRGRDQLPGEPMPELPIRELDVLRAMWTPAPPTDTQAAIYHGDVDGDGEL